MKLFLTLWIIVWEVYAVPFWRPIVWAVRQYIIDCKLIKRGVSSIQFSLSCTVSSSGDFENSFWKICNCAFASKCLSYARSNPMILYYPHQLIVHRALFTMFIEWEASWLVATDDLDCKSHYPLITRTIRLFVRSPDLISRRQDSNEEFNVQRFFDILPDRWDIVFITRLVYLPSHLI